MSSGADNPANDGLEPYYAAMFDSPADELLALLRRIHREGHVPADTPTGRWLDATFRGDVVGTPAPPFTNDSLIATSAVGAGTLIYWANLLTLGPEEKTLRAMAADMRRIAAELPGTPAPTEHCDYCHRPLPHSYAEMRVCPAPTEPTP